jgi:hypothetical protein
MAVDGGGAGGLGESETTVLPGGVDCEVGRVHLVMGDVNG